MDAFINTFGITGKHAGYIVTDMEAIFSERYAADELFKNQRENWWKGADVFVAARSPCHHTKARHGRLRAGKKVVIYNSNARKATYYIKVVGKNGAYNTSQCYTLLVQAGASGGSVARSSDPVNEITDGPNNQLLYPNPASEFVMLHFNSVTEGLVNIQIVNSSGQLVKQHPANTIKGHNQIKIQVADIRPEMYVLRINKGDLNIIRKFVIAR